MNVINKSLLDKDYDDWKKDFVNKLFYYRGLRRWPSGPQRDCYFRGLGFDSQVEQKVLWDFFMKFSVADRSYDHHGDPITGASSPST